MRLSIVSFLLACGLQFALSGAVRADSPPLADFRGPASVRNERSYQLLFLDFLPETATTLAPGHSLTRLQLDIGNDLMTPLSRSTSPDQAEVVREDTETQRLSLDWRQGLSSHTEVGASVFLLARDGGVLDRLLQHYHELTGWTHSTRDTPDGRHDLSFYHSVLFLQDSAGRTLVDAHPAVGLGDISLFVKEDLVVQPDLAVALRAGLKLPTGNAGELLGSGGGDAGLDLDVTRRLSGRRELFACLGYVVMQKDAHIATAATHQVQYAVGIEWLVRRSASIILQTDGGSRVVTTGNFHADAPPSVLTLAYKRQSGARTYTFAFGENGDIFDYRLPKVAGIGPDVTLSVGVEWRR